MVRVHSRETNNGDHGCRGSRKLLEVKWWSGGDGVLRNGGSGDLGAMMVSHIFFVVIGQE